MHRFDSLVRYGLPMAAMIFLAATLAQAEGAGEIPEEQQFIDPVVVSPDLYTVHLENEHVRVVEYRVDPGRKEPWHTHPAKVMYVLEGGTLRITLPDGTSFISEEQAGQTHWMGPVGLHSGENIGDSTVRILIVEVKAAEGLVPAESSESLRALVDPAR